MAHRAHAVQEALLDGEGLMKSTAYFRREGSYRAPGRRTFQAASATTLEFNYRFTRPADLVGH